MVRFLESAAFVKKPRSRRQAQRTNVSSKLFEKFKSLQYINTIDWIFKLKEIY